MKHVAMVLLVVLALVSSANTTFAKPPDHLRPVEYVPGQTVLPHTPHAKADTLYIFGGPGTLEGKFQTADLQPDSQGWTSEDLTLLDMEGDIWQIDSFNCANLDPGVPDNHAWWCGSTYTPCAYNPADQGGGYGNQMDVSLVWEAEVPTAGSSVTMGISFAINWDLEENFDFVALEYYRASVDSWMELALYTGTASGVLEDIPFSVNTTDLVDGTTLRLRFHGTSDVAVSSEDCGGIYGDFSSDGAAQIDNIVVTCDPGSGPVQVGDTETCEPGDPTSWSLELPPGVGDFAKVWDYLPEDLSPQLNDTPRWAFIDDGEVEPASPGYTYGFSYGPDGYCVNADGGLLGPGHLIYNMVRSPLIPLPAGDYQEVLFAFEEYLHQVYDGGYPVLTCAEFRSTADPTGADGWTDWAIAENMLWYGGPSYVTREYPILSFLVEDCTFIQVSVGVRQVDWWGAVTQISSPAPYYDNVRLKAVMATPVPSGTFVVAEDVEYVGTLEVELNCDITNAVEMRFKNGEEEWPAEWLPYADTHDWLLVDGPEGERTVHAQFRNEDDAVLELSDVVIFAPSVGVEDHPDEPLPEAFTSLVLDQNYPNPFNPCTSISFGLPEDQLVHLTVHDLSGRRVAVLHHGALGAGRHTILWDGKNSAGHQLASGTYVYRLVTEREARTRRMTLIK